MHKFFNDFLGRLGIVKKSTIYSDIETAHAIAILFRQLALADGVVKQEEIDMSINMLRQHYPDMMTKETERQFIFQIMQGERQSVFPLIKLLKKNLSVNQFEALKEQLIALAKSDQEFDSKEREFIEWVDGIHTNL